MSRIEVFNDQRSFPVARNLYGIFFEDINRAGDGGLYPELLRNRTFEDSILPDEYRPDEDKPGWVVTDSGWKAEFNHGEGLRRWILNNQTLQTPVPAWYAEQAELSLDHELTLNPHRSVSLKASFHENGLIYNTGFCGIPQRQGEAYQLRLMIHADRPVTLQVSVEENGACAIHAVYDIPGGEGFYHLEDVLTATASLTNGRFCIRMKQPGVIRLGYSSLLPQDTFMGHGLRKDIAQMLQALHPSFMRFPGGCIVEGSTISTAMRFKDTIGPVEERPGRQLVWFYRSTDGLGFHEYLQFCEDLHMEPIYVCNCGMTCQARNCRLMEGDDLQAMLQDLMDALEYALGPADSPFGSIRAAMGHPEPFHLNYLEIGNENSGPAYLSRYRLFADTVRAKYPHIKLIANDHVEKERLSADIVDEHFYSAPHFFSENHDYYDSYDRQGPQIFIGEQAVTEEYEAQLYAAIHEAAFLVGMERNQDIVALASYAPLLENVSYRSWFPNLIRFNHSASFGIPSYYVWKLFGSHRGEHVLASSVEAEPLYRKRTGAASIRGKAGSYLKNITWNGQPVGATHELMGHLKSCGDGVFWTEAPDEQQTAEAAELVPWMSRENVFVVLGDSDTCTGVFEADILSPEGVEIGLFNDRPKRSKCLEDPEHPLPEWNLRNVRPFLWQISASCCRLVEKRFPEDKILAPDQPLHLDMNIYHRYRYETDETSIRLFIDGNKVADVPLPHSPAIVSVVTETEDTILLKIVNLKPVEDRIRIQLHVPVESKYAVQLVTGEKTAENTFEKPEHVKDVQYHLQGASEDFVYAAPRYSANVLLLRKKHS